MVKFAQMPKYEAYKDSRVEWLGEIPAEWDVVRFRDLFKFGRGLTITKADLEDEGVPCINYGEVHSKYGFEFTPTKHHLKCVSKDYLLTNPNSLLEKGDFIFADTSEDIEGSGNFSQLITDDAVFAGYHSVICRPIGGNNYRYLAYCLESTSYRNQVRQQVKGVKVYSITQTILKNTEVWLPSLEEQTLIAKFLDQKTAQIDAAIAIKEQQIELLKERKQIIIQQAVTQGLDPNVPMKDSGVDWIGQIPKHWEVKKLKFLLTIKNGIDYKHVETDEGYPVYGSGGRFTYANSYLYDGEAVLLGRKGTIDKPLYVNEAFWTVDTMFYAVCNSGALAKYIYFCATTIPFSYYSTSTALPSMTQTDLLNHKLVVPSLKEQREVVIYIEKESSKIDAAIYIKKQQIQKLKEYKTTLINSAVTGKIKVTPEMLQD